MKLNSLLNSVNNILALTESTGPLRSAIDDFSSAVNVPWVLGGGLALGFHSKPRGTQDVDVFIRNEDLELIKNSLPKNKFKAHRAHAVEHRPTGVEIELLTPDFLNIDSKLINLAIERAIDQRDIRVMSRESLIALKLQRASYQDMADIITLIKSGGPANLDGYPLSDKNKQLYNKLLQEA